MSSIIKYGTSEYIDNAIAFDEMCACDLFKITIYCAPLTLYAPPLSQTCSQGNNYVMVNPISQVIHSNVAFWYVGMHNPNQQVGGCHTS